MSVCCECCVLSGRGLCDELITRPEESYRLWCVVVCNLEKQTSWMRRPRATKGLSRQEKKNLICSPGVHKSHTPDHQNDKSFVRCHLISVGVSMELKICHPCDAQNFQLAARSLENLCTPDIAYVS